MNKSIISFEKLTKKYIFKLREYRNSDYVRNNMISDAIITEDQQIKWWAEQKNNSKSLYYLIFLDSQPCGLINFVNINQAIKKAEFGIFLFEEKYANSGISLFAEFFALNFLFDQLHLNKIYLNVIDFNKKTISLHKNFGFKIDGIFRKDIIKNNQYCNLVHMSILKYEWNEKKVSVQNLLKKINNFEYDYWIK